VPFKQKFTKVLQQLIIIIINIITTTAIISSTSLNLTRIALPLWLFVSPSFS